MENFSKYIGVPGVLALALIGAVVWLAVTGRPVPAELAGLAMAAAGYYFGAKGSAFREHAANFVYHFSSDRRELIKQTERAMILLSLLSEGPGLEEWENEKEEARRLMAEWWG